MSIKIYTDESVPVSIASGLQRRGVEASSARDESNLGLTDIEQLEYAIAKGYVLLTHDADFIELAHSHASLGGHPGVVYVHQAHLSIGEVIRRVKEIVDLCSDDDLRNHIEFL